MKFAELRSLIVADYRRTSSLWSKELTPLFAIKLTFMPAMMAVLLYRFAHFFHSKGLKFLSWPIWAFNITLTGAEIMPSSKIGPGMFLGHPNSLVICGNIGSNVTIFGQSAIGGGVSDEDVGGGPGLPNIGDNVQLGFRCVILGPVKIGNDAVIAPNSYVNKDIPDDGFAAGNPCKVRKKNTEQ